MSKSHRNCTNPLASGVPTPFADKVATPQQIMYKFSVDDLGRSPLKPLSDRIRAARLAAKLSQAQLSTRVGVGRSAVAQWERQGGSKPTATHLHALAQALDCSFEWIATGRGRRSLDSLQDSGEGTAVVLQHFARDDEEERILAVFRELTHVDRAIVINLSESLQKRSYGGRRRRV